MFPRIFRVPTNLTPKKNKYGKIRKKDEDRTTRNMTKCFVSQFPLYYVKHIDIPGANVKTFEDGAEPSTVGIAGSDEKKTEVRSELRNSMSIRNKFSIPKCPQNIKQFFTQIHIGVGSKHMYKVGSFMKEHYDLRLPNYGDLPHIMTLIITNNVKNLIVDKKRIQDVVDEEKNPYNYFDFAVLFSLNCSHEVTLLEYCENRYSFVFPVYGIYDPLARIYDIISISSKHVQNKFDCVLEQVEDCIKHIEEKKDLSLLEGYHGKVNMLHGYIATLSDHVLTTLSILLKQKCGLYNISCTSLCGELMDISIESYYHVSFESKDGIKITEYRNDILELKEMYNIKISPVDHKTTILFNMKSRLANLKISDDIEYRSSLNSISSEMKEKLTQQITKEEGFPLIMTLQGRYYEDSGIEDLIPVDKHVYEEFVKRDMAVKFVPLAECPEFCNRRKFLTPRGIENPDDFDNEDLDDKSLVKNMNLEFDDQQTYSGCYTRIRAALIIDKK